MVCSGGDLILKLTTTECVSRGRPPACCWGGADRKAARLQQPLPAVRFQNGQGILPSLQTTAPDNRTETRGLASLRL